MLYNDVFVCVCALNEWVECTCMRMRSAIMCSSPIKKKKKRKRRIENGAKQHFHAIAVSMSMVNRFIDFFMIYVSVCESVCAIGPSYAFAKNTPPNTKINNFRIQ